MSYKEKDSYNNYKPVGDFIKQVKVKNTEGEYDELLGINIDKFFMPSVANRVGVDLTKYKVVQKNQFACNRMHVGRDYRIPIALSDKETPFIVSPAYDVFEIIDTSVLLPEYLMMWFSRAEFDRNAWYYTDADVRGGLPWDAFCKIKLPIPSIEKQCEIVAEYKTVQNRIQLNEQLIHKLEETAQTIYRRWFVEFEFPINKELAIEMGDASLEGKPYRTSGGKMVWNEELENEVPEEWEVKSFTKVIKLSGGGTPDTKDPSYWNGEIPFFTPADVCDGYYTIHTDKSITKEGLKKSSTKLYPKNTIFVTARGTVGAIAMAGREMAMNQSCYAISGDSPFYIHQLTLNTVNKAKKEAVGAVFAALVTKDFDSQFVIQSPIEFIRFFDIQVKTLYDNILSRINENQSLKSAKDFLLSKLTTL